MSSDCLWCLQVQFHLLQRSLIIFCGIVIGPIPIHMNLLRDVFGLPLVFAGTISFIAAILNNFLWNRYWTYPDSRSKKMIRQLLEFSIVSATGLVIRIPILKFVEPLMYRLVNWYPLKFPYISLDALSANLTLAIAVIIVMFWNFFVNRYWTYSDVA